jgi:ankyrin repeat protein/predicted aspartyl protease
VRTLGLIVALVFCLFLNPSAALAEADSRSIDSRKKCGLFCLSFCAHVLGISENTDSILELPVFDQRGVSLSQLQGYAKEWGMESRAFRSDLPTLLSNVSVHAPAIVSTASKTHYVVTLGFDPNGRVIVYDVITFRRQIMPVAQFSTLFGGEWLLVVRSGEAASLYANDRVRRFYIVVASGGLIMLVVSCLKQRLVRRGAAVFRRRRALAKRLFGFWVKGNPMKGPLMVSVVLCALVSWCHGGSILFPKDGESVTVPLVRAGSYLLAPVRIGDRDCGLFVVDTGSSHLVIDNKLAEALKLHRIATGMMKAVGGERETSIYALPNVSVGGVSAGDTFVAAIDFDQLRDAVGAKEINGILGNDFLRKLPFTIDWRRARLTFYKRSHFPSDSIGDEYRLRVIGSVPAVESTIERELQGWLLIDTGSTSELILHTPFANVHADWLQQHPWKPKTVLGAAGPHRSRGIRLDSLEVLGTQLTDVDVSYSQEAGIAASSSGAGSVGIPLLKPHQMTFDFDNERIWIKRGSDRIPQEWLDTAFDPHSSDASGVTPLMRAAEEGRSDYVAKFISAGANVNAVSNKSSVALHFAAESGDLQSCEMLIKAGASIDAADAEHATPLLRAASSGSASVTEALLKGGANVEAEDVFGRTALVLAAEQGHAPIVAQLIKAGADVKHVSRASGTALNAAAAGGYAEIVRKLLASGGNAAGVDPFKRIPVIFVGASGGSVEVVQLLLENGAKVESATPDGQTPLFAAALNGHADIAKLLLDVGADPDVRDHQGLTALECATARGNFGVMEVLYYRTRSPVTTEQMPVGG